MITAGYFGSIFLKFYCHTKEKLNNKGFAKQVSYPASMSGDLNRLAIVSNCRFVRRF